MNEIDDGYRPKGGVGATKSDGFGEGKSAEAEQEGFRKLDTASNLRGEYLANAVDFQAGIKLNTEEATAVYVANGLIPGLSVVKAIDKELEQRQPGKDQLNFSIDQEAAQKQPGQRNAAKESDPKSVLLPDVQKQLNISIDQEAVLKQPGQRNFVKESERQGSKSGTKPVSIIDKEVEQKQARSIVEGKEQKEPSPRMQTIVPEKKGDQHPDLQKDKTIEKTSFKKPDAPTSPKDILLDKNAKPEEKILAAKELAKSGTTWFKDDSGKVYRINIQDYGKREGVVVTVGGIPALRGIVEKGDNRVSRQRNPRGEEVDYAGDRARKVFKDNPVVTFKR